ncbi:hypothetical protein OWV82_015304 [Melia azedarach]|uniref:Uncharacterized protein n=1 Tax=Melia azedarach TaxID=155640 RepID=A0ACC1XPU2_MELAZ|nr:hypothetical protein OWV82_015304 [Melia azedarach]
MRVVLLLFQKFGSVKNANQAKAKSFQNLINRSCQLRSLAKAIKLKLGAPEVKLFSWTDLYSHPGCQTGTVVPKSKRTPRFKRAPSKFSLQQVNAYPGVVAATECKPLGQGSGEILSITQQQVPQTLKEMKGEETPSQCWPGDFTLTGL